MENRSITVRIERMAPEGQGLGRPCDSGLHGHTPSGPIFFVPYSVPGDVLELTPVRTKKNYQEGRIARILKPGPGRIPPPCPLHFQSSANEQGNNPLPCGGCDWQQLDYGMQLKAKQEIVRDCLRRIAKLPDIQVEDTFPSRQIWRYRNKAQIPMGLKFGRLRAGFYAPGSHEIVDYADCLVQPELSVQLTLKVKKLAQDLRWSIYDEKKHSGWLRHILIRTNQRGQALLVLITRSPQFPDESRFIREIRSSFPQLVGLFQNVQPLKTSVVLGRGWRKLWGQDGLEERLGSLRLRFSPSAFLQINTPACQNLYEVAKSFLSQAGMRPKLVLDLYCGIGSIALWIADCADRILGIEENQQALKDAWFNARLNGVRNIKFKAGLVENLQKYLYKELDSVEQGEAAAILDPPRSGLNEAALPIFKAPGLSRLVYVSCNPATLARDIARLASYGWRLSRIKPVDLFPQTSHVESVALLERMSSR